MTTRAAHTALCDVLDPEMPISIVDLGIVHDVRETGGGAVEVDITPTFVGCPALDVLESMIRERLTAAGAAAVRVRFINDPPWSVARISDAGREALRRHGVTVPHRDLFVSREQAALVPLTISGAERVACPFCGSSNTDMESRFGPTRCRTIYYCANCRNQFEHMKAV